MGIPILSELHQETDRLFIAGSRFSKGDSRIKKYIAPLAKMGEKAPVFLKLSEQLSDLTECAPEQSAKKLIEIKSLLLSILNTQGDMGVTGDIILFDHSNDIADTSKTYAELSPVFEMLKKSGSSRLETLKDLHEKGVFDDPRTIKAVVDALGDGNYELVNHLIDVVIPCMDKLVYDYLHDGFRVDGKSADANRLRAIYRLKNREALPFVESCLEKGSDQVKVTAIGILSNHIEYQDVLIDYLHEKKVIKEAAADGLAKMDTQEGINALVEIFDSKDGKDVKLVKDSLAANTGINLTQKLALLAVQRYEAAVNNLDDKKSINKLYDIFEVISNKKDKNIADLMKKVLTERKLDEITKILSKEEQMSHSNIYDTALSILYRTTLGYDFIWDLFAKKPTKLGSTLTLYAFYIGIEKLNSEQFFDMFFKTDLFSDVYKLDRGALEYILQYAIDNKKPLSIRLAEYFINKKDFSSAIRVVSIKDKKSVYAILNQFDENMDRNIYAYVNYLILVFAGENKLPEFSSMYEKYCEKNHGSNREREYLQQYLSK